MSGFQQERLSHKQLGVPLLVMLQDGLCLIELLKLIFLKQTYCIVQGLLIPPLVPIYHVKKPLHLPEGESKQQILYVSDIWLQC